ncbi:MAG: hypothetical protein IT228_07530 [Flavobacteriales bacterium]|nr:hypothetical protein [Flavobacteriales bacterium]MCC6577176.1 hypothetical protein [Flavobacteriales bacterium]NUQ16134.1 hypothetical protein [Flavobacteriales bacterium]
MRAHLPLLFAAALFAPCAARAQWAVGLFGGLGQDQGWQGRSSWMGGLVERRLGDSTSFVLRLSGLALTPLERVYGETVVADDGTTDVEAVMRELIGRSAAMLSVRWPFLTVPCDGGYHRGAYVMAGAGWEHARVRQTGYAVQEQVGPESVVVRERSWTVDRFVGAAAVGAQYGTRWGSPFLEVHMNAGPMPYDTGLWGITLVGVQVGYRYVFVKR